MTGFVPSRILASPRRGDGHDEQGNPGDCLRACVATVMGLRYELVPHFAQYRSWWEWLRRWARTMHGTDWACVLPVNGSIRHALRDPRNPTGHLVRGMYIACGPSPRGQFHHVVVVDLDLRLMHDPHPSGDGIQRVDEVFVWCHPYGEIPQLTLLEGTVTQ